MWWPFRGRRAQLAGLPAGCSDFAVLLIDMQDRFVGKLKTNVRTKLIEAQLQVIRDCANRNIPVIILEYHGREKTISKLADDLDAIERKTVICKPCDDGFKRTRLDETLRYIGARSLLLMGINAHACVLETAQSAVKKGYKVITSEDLIADAYHDEILDEGREWYEANGCFRPIPLQHPLFGK